MREDLLRIAEAIIQSSLPSSFDQLFGGAWDDESQRFTSQETFILDYKEEVPEDFSGDYGASIIRLALSFHNAFGGIVVFGVRDRKMTVETGADDLDVESFNRSLSDFCGIPIECISRPYVLPGRADQVSVLLVPKRRSSSPVALKKRLSKYKVGTVWIRERHECVEAQPRHLPILYSSRDLSLEDRADFPAFPVHRSLPPSPATMKHFVSRGRLMDELWEWVVRGDRPRLYLHGPGGSGKSTLAFEFAKLLSEYGHSIRFANDEHFDYVVFISAKETELNVHALKEQKFTLRQFKDADEQSIQIVYHSGLLDEERIASATREIVSEMLSELFDTFNGLIVVDDIDALSRKQADTGEETLLLQCVKSRKRNKILYTLRNAPAYALGIIRLTYQAPSASFLALREHGRGQVQHY